MSVWFLDALGVLGLRLVGFCRCGLEVCGCFSVMEE